MERCNVHTFPPTKPRLLITGTTSLNFDTAQGVSCHQNNTVLLEFSALLAVLMIGAHLITAYAESNVRLCGV
jgi:hypothetical protein